MLFQRQVSGAFRKFLDIYIAVDKHIRHPDRSSNPESIQ